MPDSSSSFPSAVRVAMLTFSAAIAGTALAMIIIYSPATRTFVFNTMDLLSFS
jgi:hypothetical protein